METAKYDELLERGCEGALSVHNNGSDVIPFRASQKTINPFAVLMKEEHCATPVCGESFHENRGACKGCYTLYPVDVNRVHDGTMQPDTLNLERVKTKGSYFHNSILERLREDTLDVTLRNDNQQLRNTGYKEQFEQIRVPKMVELRLTGDVKKDNDFKNNSGDVKAINSRLEDKNTKWLANDMPEDSLDVDMENLMFLENELSSIDGYLNMKKDIHDKIFDSASVKQDSFPMSNHTLPTDELAQDFFTDFAPYLRTYTGNMKEIDLAANTIVQGETDSLILNEDQMKCGPRTDEIHLLTEALRTRSFAPIVYLLSLLTKDSNGFVPGTTSESDGTPGLDIKSSSDDNVSTSSSLSDQRRRLSWQESYESDRSSVLSVGGFGKRVSECDLSDLERGEGTSLEDQSIDFLTLQPARGIYQNAVKGEDLTDNSNESDVVNVFENILSSNSACDLQIFKQLLENESIETAANHRPMTKTWTEASTETRESRDTNIAVKENEQRILEDQNIVGM